MIVCILCLLLSKVLIVDLPESEYGDAISGKILC